MRRNVVAAQLLIFAVISVSIIAYTLFGVIGVNPLAHPIRVTVTLKTGGGIFDGSEVAFRGVGVGRVSSVELHRDRVTLHLSIDEGTRIPADSIAHVYDLSVVGEQYLDLVPRTQGGPVLRSGDTIPAERTTTPVATATVLLDVEQLVTSLDPGDIRTVTRELGLAFANSGPQLRQILTAGGSIVSQLSDSRAATVRLVRNGRIVLDTVARHTRDFRVFADSLQQLTATLKSSTPAAEKLLAQSPATTRTLDALVRDNASAAAVLMSNLVTFGGIQVANIPGLKALLVAVPEFGRLLPQIVRGGEIQAALLINGNSRVCSSGLPLSSPISGTRSPVVRAACADAALLPRGAANAPPPLARTASTRSGAGSSPSSAAARRIAAYDPTVGLVRTPDGRTIRLGADGGQDQLFGTRSWQTLLYPAGAP